MTRKSLGELVYFFLLFAAVVVAFRPEKSTLKKLTFLLGFEGFLFLLALFNPGEAIFSTPFGDVTREGVSLFFLLLGKAFLSAGTALIVVESAGFTRILAEMEALRVPRVLILTLAFTYRYIDLFVEETTRMKRALDSRAFGVGRAEYYRKLASLFGEVFVRAYLRSGRVYRAMLARGGFGEFPVFEEPRPTPGTVVLMALAAGGGLIL
ncbi:energy-coupling factor transporter transmembrane protein EcfT [Thermococcus sp. JCM 11816]|uniref:energy-coupling factor transporter transmembrane component T family protein n=1 Tax=Thermococcus sp. (strain JCM 11816 / KS-1) TaxID=1295125 RepID=UPI000AFB33FF